jgi:hypothetical protein
MKTMLTMRRACLLALALAVAIPVAGQQPGITADQAARQAELMSKLVAAESVVARDEAALGRKYDTAFRNSIIKGLTSKSLNDIWATSPDTVSTNAVGIGDSEDNLVYNPVTPCRIIDTRIVGGAIGAGGIRSFVATGLSFIGQGGVVGGCGIPFGPATAVVINFVAVSPSGAGDLRVWPFGQGAPLASIINYVPGANVANGVPIAICNPAVFGCGEDITVQSDAASVQIVADVQGFFSRPSAPVSQNLAAVVTAAGGLVSGQSFRATAASLLVSSFYQVDFDRDITNCSYVADIGDPGAGGSTPGFVTVTGRAADPNGLFIGTYNAAGAATTRNFFVHVICPAAPTTP